VGQVREKQRAPSPQVRISEPSSSQLWEKRRLKKRNTPRVVEEQKKKGATQLREK